MGGHVPYGFRLDADGPTLIEDATEHAVIQRITVMRSSGSTYHRIADMLNGEHVPTRTGKPWSGKVLWRILKRQAS